MTQEITIKKSTYNQILVGIVVLAVAFSFATGYMLGGSGSITGNVVAQQQPQPVAQQQPQQQQPSRVQVSVDDDPVIGSANAPLTIIEFSDYQCPFCQRFHQETWPQLKADYVDTGKVKFVYRDYPLPFHQNAEIAAEAANCAGEQGKYWEMHDELFAKGSGDGTGLDAASLKSYAAGLGLNAATFATCLDGSKYASEIQKDTADGSTAGVSGTPTFYIGTPSKSYTQIVGAVPYAVIKQTIDQELAA